ISNRVQFHPSGFIPAAVGQDAAFISFRPLLFGTQPSPGILSLNAVHSQILRVGHRNANVFSEVLILDGQVAWLGRTNESFHWSAQRGIWWNGIRIPEVAPGPPVTEGILAGAAPANMRPGICLFPKIVLFDVGQDGCQPTPIGCPACPRSMPSFGRRR